MPKKTNLELQQLGASEFGKILKEGEISVRGGKATIVHSRKTRGKPIVNTYHIKLPPILVERELPEEDEPVKKARKKPGPKPKAEKTRKKPGPKPKLKADGTPRKKPGPKPKVKTESAEETTEKKPKRKARTGRKPGPKPGRKPGRKPRVKKETSEATAEKPAAPKPESSGVPWGDEGDIEI